MAGIVAAGWGIRQFLVAFLEWRAIQTARQMNRLRLLRRFSEQLQSTIPHEEIIQWLLDVMVKDFGFAMARLALIHDGNFVLYAPSKGKGAGQEAAPQAQAMVTIVPGSDSPLFRAAESGKVVFSGRSGGTHRGIFVPLKTQQKVIGVLLAVSGPTEPEREQIETLMIIAAQAGLAIANAQNYAAARRAQAELLDQEHELKEAEETLIQTVRLSALGELSLSVAHELNNPMTVILGLIQLARKRPGTSGPTGENLGIMEEASQRCRKIVSDLLAYSNWEDPERIQLDVNEVIQRVVAMLNPELLGLGIECHLLLSPQPLYIHANREQMEEVIMNLLVNAREAMPQGGLLLVQTQISDGGHWLTISVKDTGTGIPADITDKIFEPFFTTKKEAGTGLGLAICHEVIRRHQGSIQVNSRINEGTEFLISLPRLQGVGA